jgi:hypothetical protein
MSRHAPNDTDTRTKAGPDELTGDMTINDLTYVLENLAFTRSGASLLSVDREVRNYLLRKIQQR